MDQWLQTATGANAIETFIKAQELQVISCFKLYHFNDHISVTENMPQPTESFVI